MTYDRNLFKELSKENTLKVQVGDDKCIVVKGKFTLALITCLGVKFIFDVLYVLKID